LFSYYFFLTRYSPLAPPLFPYTTLFRSVAARFLAYGWNVLRVGDAHDLERIAHALEVFRQTPGRPTCIILDSHIGYGAPTKQDRSEEHTSELQSLRHLVCRLLLEKKNTQ